MTAKVIRLSKVVIGFEHSLSGAKYPRLYRCKGFYFDEVKPGKEFAPSERPAPVYYSFSDEETRGYANVRFEPIRHLDPLQDKGWLVVRNHGSRQALETYKDALFDMFDELDSWGAFETPHGYFTVFHRPPKHNCPDHLIIYHTKYLRGDEWVEHPEIVLPDGSSTISDRLLHPEYDGLFD